MWKGCGRWPIGVCTPWYLFISNLRTYFEQMLSLRFGRNLSRTTMNRSFYCRIPHVWPWLSGADCVILCNFPALRKCGWLCLNARQNPVELVFGQRLSVANLRRTLYQISGHSSESAALVHNRKLISECRSEILKIAIIQSWSHKSGHNSWTRGPKWKTSQHLSWIGLSFREKIVAFPEDLPLPQTCSLKNDESFCKGPSIAFRQGGEISQTGS